MKYSTVKSPVFGAAQETMGQNKLKLLRAAPTRWLSHGEASKRLVSRFEPLVNDLDSILNSKDNAEVQGIKENLLEPNTILFLLLLSVVLTHVNRFSKCLQTRNLVLTTVARKFVQLKRIAASTFSCRRPFLSRTCHTLYKNITGSSGFGAEASLC